MRLLFASDIHGSKFYMERLIELIQKEKADKVILLGDLLYHGPRNPLTKEYNPKEVAEILNGMKDKLICVRGNCDSEVDQMVLDFPIMADYSQFYIDGLTFYLTHGHLTQPEDLKEDSKTIYTFGHIHIPVLKKEHVYLFNPGSITLPKNDFGNSYAVYENKRLQIKTIDEEVIKEVTFK